MVGVDYKPFYTENTDKSTDHFVVIVGRGHDSKGNYYVFMENATSDMSDGCSSLNRLYEDRDNARLIGTSQAPPRSAKRDYTVTQIRTNDGNSY